MSADRLGVARHSIALPRCASVASVRLALLLAVPALTAFGARALSGAHPIDDAYITFRYARNLGEGFGLVYNPGEWVLGTTSPAWAVLLAVGYRLGATDVPKFALLLAATCDAISAALLARWSVRLGWSTSGAILVGLAWALNPMSIGFASGGMETSLFIVLTLIALGLASDAGGRARALGGSMSSARPGVRSVPPSARTRFRRLGAALSAALPGAGGPFRMPDTNVSAALPCASSAPPGARTRFRWFGAGLISDLLCATGHFRVLGGTVSSAPPGAGGRSRLLGAAALAGASVLVRPEGALVLAAIVGWTWFASRRDALQVAVCGALPMLGAAAALAVAYGSPLPNSIAAKAVAYQPGPMFDNALALAIQAGLPGWSTYLLAAIPPLVSILLSSIGLVTLILLVRCALFGLKHTAIAWQPFAAFSVLYVLFYAALGLRGVRLFPWYLAPLGPLYLLAAAAGLAHLDYRRRCAATHAVGVVPESGALAGARPFGPIRGASIFSRLIAHGTGVPWLAAVLLLWQLPAIDWRQPLLPLGQDFQREQLLLQVGRDLAPTLPVNAVIAAPEIGALGYASGARILDTTGLVSPSALNYYPLPSDELVTDNAIPPGLIDDQLPHMVVAFDAFAQRSLLADPRFLRDYRLEQRLAATVWQSRQLLVFRRIDSTSTSGT